jgi:methionine biosynthesis protein MetW
MQMRSSINRFSQSSLDAEDTLNRIPLRKEYLLHAIGRGKRVLDVGCLSGQISRMILEQNNEVWGVEIDQQAAELARKRGIRVKVADVEEGLPFESGAFDFVNAGEVVEQLYDTKLFFEECHRVLRPEGILIFTAPNLNSLGNRLKVVAGGYPSMVGAYPEDHYGEHIRVFNLRKIRELCTETGFAIEDVRGIPTLEPKGRWLDGVLRAGSRVFPGLSKLLIIKARRREWRA